MRLLLDDRSDVAPDSRTLSNLYIGRTAVRVLPARRAVRDHLRVEHAALEALHSPGAVEGAGFTENDQDMSVQAVLKPDSPRMDVAGSIGRVRSGIAAAPPPATART